jgi:hypothetical protein
VRHRRVEVRLAAQDLVSGRRDAAAPDLRLGCTAGIRLHVSLRVCAALFRSRLGTGLQGSLRWSPLPVVAMHQEIRLPGGPMQTGLEIDSGPATTGFWIEPTSRIGPRIGLTCSVRGGPGGP